MVEEFPPSQHHRSVRFATPFIDTDAGDDDDISDLQEVTDSMRQSAGGSSVSSGRKSSTSSPSSSSLGGGESLRSNLMRQQKNRDPLFYYEVLSILGCGSMGSVARVKKRDEVIGGSARSSIVASFHKEKKKDECFQVPLFGPLFKFCTDAADHYSEHSGMSWSKSTRSTAEDSLVLVPSVVDEVESTSSSTNRSRKADIVYAMKSIHLSRIKEEAYVNELLNEIELLRKLDHPHIVRPIETFYFRNEIFVVMELCSGGDLYSRDPYSVSESWMTALPKILYIDLSIGSPCIHSILPGGTSGAYRQQHLECDSVYA